MANGKKKETKGKGNNNQAIKNARAGKKGDGLYYYREGVKATKARRAAVKSGAIEQTPKSQLETFQLFGQSPSLFLYY